MCNSKVTDTQTADTSGSKEYEFHFFEDKVFIRNRLQIFKEKHFVI